MITKFFLIFFWCQAIGAQMPTPLSTHTFQLEKLIQQSEQQIQATKELIKYKKQDSQSLENLISLLNGLSKGLDQSIEKYKGTEIYQKALIESQVKDDYQRTYKDSQVLVQQHPSKITDKSDKEFIDIIGIKEFQKKSVKANRADLVQQQNIQKIINNSSPVFLQKVGVQTLLAQWRTQTRLSMQMTELLAVIHAMREEMRSERWRQQPHTGLNTLIEGSQLQNQIQKQQGSPP